MSKRLFDDFYKFFFSFKQESNSIPIQQFILILSFYLAFIASLFIIPLNIINDFNKGNIFIVFSEIVFITILVSGLVIFLLSRRTISLRIAFTMAIFLITSSLIINGGGTKGFGIFYIISGYSIAFFLIGLKGGIIILALVYIGFIIRFFIGDFNPHSIFNNYENLTTLMKILTGATIIGLMSIIFNKIIFNQLVKVAYYDDITSLYNKIKITEILNEMIEGKIYFKKSFSVMAIKINQFSKINAHQGSQTADLILKEFSNRLKYLTDKKTIIGRYSGTVFILISEIYDFEDIDTIAGIYLNDLQTPFKINDNYISLSINVVVTRYPDDGDNANKLITNLMNSITKVSSMPGILSFFDENNFIMDKRKYHISEELIKAIENEELSLVYHPKLHLKDNSVQGAEILLRWTNKIYQNVSPSVFIPIAEEIGIISKITRWVAERAAKDILKINDIIVKSSNKLIFAINLSPLDLANPHFIEFLESFKKYSKLLSDYVEFEITEGVMMNNNPIVENTLDYIKKSGYRIAIDDFGTGYSSLSYLHNLNTNNLKIDQSFIKPINESNPESPIVEAVVSMAKSLNLEITAEGIETKFQEEYLKNIGCDYGQGWLYSKPLKLEDFIEWILKR